MLLPEIGTRKNSFHKSSRIEGKAHNTENFLSRSGVSNSHILICVFRSGNIAKAHRNVCKIDVSTLACVSLRVQCIFFMDSPWILRHHHFKSFESFDKKEERNGKKKKERKQAAGRIACRKN